MIWSSSFLDWIHTSSICDWYVYRGSLFWKTLRYLWTQENADIHKYYKSRELYHHARECLGTRTRKFIYQPHFTRLRRVFICSSFYASSWIYSIFLTLSLCKICRRTRWGWIWRNTGIHIRYIKSDGTNKKYGIHGCSFWYGISHWPSYLRAPFAICDDTQYYPTLYHGNLS